MGIYSIEGPLCFLRPPTWKDAGHEGSPAGSMPRSLEVRLRVQGLGV